MKFPRISVVVPCRNESGHIQQFLDGLRRQVPVHGGFEVIVADGASDDGTMELLAATRNDGLEVRVVDNPEMIVSTGLNRAIKCARGEIVVRMDVHTCYADNYLAECVAVLEETEASNVGGPWCARGQGYWQDAIALAFESRFVSGGARSHDLSYEGPVDSVYLGCWRTEYLISTGLFDESLVRNQDDELNLRIVRSGGVVWQSPRIRSWYRPRPTLKGLFRQYMQYGFWKVRVIKKHGTPASLRHVAPALAIVLFLIALVFSPISRIALIAVIALIAMYFVASALVSVALCVSSRRWRYLSAFPLVIGVFHLAYGVGFLAGIWSSIAPRRQIHARYQRLTR